MADDKKAQEEAARLFGLRSPLEPGDGSAFAPGAAPGVPRPGPPSSPERSIKTGNPAPPQPGPYDPRSDPQQIDYAAELRRFLDPPPPENAASKREPSPAENPLGLFGHSTGTRFSVLALLVFLAGNAVGDPLCIAAGDHLVKREWVETAIGFGLGIPLVAIAWIFPFRRDLFPSAFRASISRHAYRWWPLAVLLAFIYVVGPDIYRRAIQPVASSTTESTSAAVSPERWPALTSAESTAFTARARQIPPENIVVVCENINCKDLADGIGEILLKTPDWKVELKHGGGIGVSGLVGIRLNPIEPATQALKEALESTAHLQITLGPDTGVNIGSGLPPTYLIIGTRPF